MLQERRDHFSGGSRLSSDGTLQLHISTECVQCTVCVYTCRGGAEVANYRQINYGFEHFSMKTEKIFSDWRKAVDCFNIRFRSVWPVFAFNSICTALSRKLTNHQNVVFRFLSRHFLLSFSHFFARMRNPSFPKVLCVKLLPFFETLFLKAFTLCVRACVLKSSWRAYKTRKSIEPVGKKWWSLELDQPWELAKDGGGWDRVGRKGGE